LKDFPVFTLEDFLNTTKPYEFVYSFQSDAFQLHQVLEKVAKNAGAVQFRAFKKTYESYVLTLKQKEGYVIADSTTQFEGQELELDCGQWRADEFGVSTVTGYGAEEFACVHPILPVLRLVNIDTGAEKLKIAYRKGKQWRHVIADKRTLASNASILSLAEVGIAVNSENSRLLVKYLHDVENRNYDFIPEKNSVGRLGWIDGEGFSPYVDGLVFDGDANYKAFFESVREQGSYEEWLRAAKEARAGSVPARLALAGSFASVLVKPLGGLPFFIHLWGGTEVGKTVGLMLAASVWANPEIGRYIHTFNSTAVGREKAAAFVNSMPLILDELQISKEKREFDKDIYLLSEGVGKTRGNKSGGVDQTPTWSNCILSNGEMPITTASSGGGAVNRIIEVECTGRMFENPREAAAAVKRNYGFAGKRFVEKLQEEGSIARAEELFREYYRRLSENDTTEKQAMAAAMVLTADRLATDWIFQDGQELTPEGIRDFLQTREAVSANRRGYTYLCEYVVQNANHFCGESQDIEVWGKLDGDQAFIVRREFDRICADAGYNGKALLSWMRDNGKLELPQKGFTKPKRINKIPCNCVVMRLLPEQEEPRDGELIPG
jgi:hypothetical protein